MIESLETPTQVDNDVRRRERRLSRIYDSYGGVGDPGELLNMAEGAEINAGILAETDPVAAELEQQRADRLRADGHFLLSLEDQ